MDLAQIRSQYVGNSIADLPDQPHLGIERWLEEALHSEDEPTAFSLATHTKDAVSVRVVLAKSISENGLVFYSNASSAKGRQLEQTSYAAGVFFWPKLHRQIRFEGRVGRLDEKLANEYFASRPLESQIAAAVSAQSEAIEDYETLVERFEKAKRDFSDGKVPRPKSWGGYSIAFERVEFWQGQPNRLHQRLLYTRKDDGRYSRVWLQP